MAGSTWFHVATVSEELRGDAGEDRAPLAAPSIYLTMMTYLGKKKREGRGSFMGIDGIIKYNRKPTCCQNPYEGCTRLRVSLDACFMGAEHDRARLN